MTRAEAAQRWEATMTQLEVRYVVRVLEALRDQYAVFAATLRHGGPQAAEQMILGDYLNSKIGSIIKEMYLAVGSVMADRTKKAINPKKSMVQVMVKTMALKAAKNEFADEINEFFRLHLLNKTVFKISQTTRKRLLEILTEGARTGASVDQMVAQVSELKELEARARMIVRTETVRAANYGVYLGAKKADYETTKEWLEIVDNRTRLLHRHGTGVGGQIVDIDKRFSNGLLFPGDPEGIAEEVINCRCRIVVKAKRDQHGRPIRKTTTNPAPVYDRRSTGIMDAMRRIEALIQNR